MAVVTPQQRVGFPQRNPYAMDMDRRENRSCYTCGGFGHMACHCRNRGGRVAKGRRLEYGKGGIKGNFEHLNNLKVEENLEFLD